MEYKDTPEGRSLAAVIERDAKATTGLNLARRACWYGGAVALCLLGGGGLLAGAGIGAQKAQEGYASIIASRESAERAREIAERAAQTTAAMLANEREEFHAMLAATKLQGTVTGSVTLANTTLHLDPIPPVHVDVNATMRAAALAPDMRAAIFDPPPQAPNATLRLDQSRIQPAAEASAMAAQGAPRLPVVEPPPQLHTISLPAGTVAKAGPALPALPRKSVQSEPLTCKGNLP
jgi:hypothetical protein